MPSLTSKQVFQVLKSSRVYYLKVSKFQKQIFLFSFETKNQTIFFFFFDFLSFTITEIRKTGHQPQVFTILNLWSRDMEPPLKLLEMVQVPLVPGVELWPDQNTLDSVQIPAPIQPDLIQLIQDKSTGSWILQCQIRPSKVSQPKVQCSDM